MSAVKSGATPLAGTITISGTGNTIYTIASDIADKAWAELVGNVLTIKCRYINIVADGELIIGDANDFSVAEELRHLFVGTNGYNRLYVYEGGSFKMYGDTKCILNYNCTSAQYPDYCYFIGKVHIEGDDTYKPILKGSRRFYFNYQPINETYHNSSELTLYKCKIGECQGNYAILINFYSAIYKTFLIEEVQIINGLYNIAQYGINVTSRVPVKNYTPVTNITNDESVKAYQKITAGSWGLHLKDSVWVATYATYPFEIGASMELGGSSSETFDWLLTDTQKELKKAGQWISGLFDNVDIQTTYSYQGYIYDGARLVMKGCPNTNNKNVLIYTGAHLLCWNSDNCFNRVAVDNYNSFAKKVFLLDLTIQDLQENPLADATIKVKQKDGYEEYTLTTNSNGKIIALHGLTGVLLANAVRKTTSETLVYWSDSSNSSYHTVTVLKEGYKAETFNIVMDADKSQTVQLRPLTKMYLGSTEITGIGV